MSIPAVLIPGAGGQGWGWHLVEAGPRRRGYEAFAARLTWPSPRARQA